MGLFFEAGEQEYPPYTRARFELAELGSAGQARPLSPHGLGLVGSLGSPWQKAHSGAGRAGGGKRGEEGASATEEVGEVCGGVGVDEGVRLLRWAEEPLG